MALEGSAEMMSGAARWRRTKRSNRRGTEAEFEMSSGQRVGQCFAVKQEVVTLDSASPAYLRTAGERWRQRSTSGPCDACLSWPPAQANRSRSSGG